LAANWQWHVEYDGMYLATTLPRRMRESLMSYLAVYNDNIQTNPLRLLFLACEPEDCRDATRLDLGNGIGAWTSLSTLEKDLTVSTSPQPASEAIPDSWDAEPDPTNTHAIPVSLKPSMTFSKVRHLSLAISPDLPVTARPSWRALLRLLSNLAPLTSLSLAHWPTPTYTPRAAQTYTRVNINNQPTTGSANVSSPRVVYGGTNFYSELDNDWREAAGILSSLSRRTPALEWLDLSGCGDWWDALCWRQLGTEAEMAGTASGPDNGAFEFSRMGDGDEPADDEGDDTFYALSVGARPNWNAEWRGIRTLVLKIGWTVTEPDLESDEQQASSSEEDGVLRLREAHRLETAKLGTLRRRQRDVGVALRMVRRAGLGAGWLEVVV
jgi:hypothetical protein